MINIAFIGNGGPLRHRGKRGIRFEIEGYRGRRGSAVLNN